MIDSIGQAWLDVSPISGDSITASWRRIMFLDGYVDDSGSDKTGKTFVLGGVVMPRGWWENWQNDWSGVLKSDPPIEYFKASEVWERDISKGTPFCHLPDGERKKKVDALVEVFADYRPKMLSVRMEWNTFHRFSKMYALTADKNEPYFWLFYGMITFGMWVLDKEHNPTPIDWIFDSQNIIGDRARAYYWIFHQMCIPPIRSRLGNEPSFGDEKILVPLQGADLFAWYRRRDSLGTLYSEWHARIWAVMDQFHSSCEMAEDNLSYMARNLAIMERP
jgi:hypothetical protein